MKYLLAFLLAVALGFGASVVRNERTTEAAPCVTNCPAGQPHPDIFQYPGVDMQAINPVAVKIKAQRTVSYSLQVVSGCSLGSIAADLNAMAADSKQSLGVTIVRDDAHPDLTVYVNCGNGQIALCGSVNIFCLNHGFPYNDSMDISDILSTYQPVTRQSILQHEWFHAMASYSEQYCQGNEPSGNPCAGLPLFANTPNWNDIMSTGPLTRHPIGDIEKDRWTRTMYQVPGVIDCTPQGPNADGLWWYPCEGKFYNQQLWSFDPATGAWADQKGSVQFLSCNADRLRWSPAINRWTIPGVNLGFDPALGLFVVVPGC